MNEFKVYEHSFQIRFFKAREKNRAQNYATTKFPLRHGPGKVLVAYQNP